MALNNYLIYFMLFIYRYMKIVCVLYYTIIMLYPYNIKNKIIKILKKVEQHFR